MAKKRTKSKWDGKVPFDKGGNALSDVRPSWRTTPPPIWKDNYIFEDSLAYKSGTNNRLIFEDEMGRTYPMFVSELGRSLRWAQVMGDIFEARWTFRRGGQNFSLRVAPPLPCCHCGKEPHVDDFGKVVHRCLPDIFYNMHLTQWDRQMKKRAGIKKLVIKVKK